MCANSSKSHPPLSSGPTLPLHSPLCHEATAHILPTPCQTLGTTAYFTSPSNSQAPVAPAWVAFLGWEPCLVIHWAFCPS